MILRLPSLPFGFASKSGDLVVNIERVSANESESEPAQVVIGDRTHTVEPFKRALLVPQLVRYAAVISPLEKKNQDVEPIQLTRWLRSQEEIEAVLAAGIQINNLKHDAGSVKRDILDSLSIAPGVEIIG